MGCSSSKESYDVATQNQTTSPPPRMDDLQQQKEPEEEVVENTYQFSDYAREDANVVGTGADRQDSNLHGTNSSEGEDFMSQEDQSQRGDSQIESPPTDDEEEEEDDSFINTPLPPPINETIQGEDWRSYHADLRKKLLVDRVKFAYSNRDRDLLSQTLTECKQIDSLAQHPDVIKGQEILEILIARDDLNTAMKENDVTKIEEEIALITQSSKYKHLQQEVMKAKLLIELIRRGGNTQEAVLPMDKKTMSEIRRYQKPPKLLHRMIQTSLLLLGEDELTTSDWVHCQKLLNPQGNREDQRGFSKKLLDFNKHQVHPDIWARSRQILTEETYDTRSGLAVSQKQVNAMHETERAKFLASYNIGTIQKVSPAAATFFVWSMGITEACEREYDYSNGEPIPADIPRQLVIFNRTSMYKNNPNVPKKLRRKIPVDAHLYLQRETNGGDEDFLLRGY